MISDSELDLVSIMILLQLVRAFENLAPISSVDETLDHHLIHRLIGRQTHLTHSHRVLFGCLLEHNRGASIEHQAHLTIADELVSFIDQSLVSRSRSNNASGNLFD